MYRMANHEITSRKLYVQPVDENETSTSNSDKIRSEKNNVPHHKVTLEYDLGELVLPGENKSTTNREQCYEKVELHYQLSAVNSDDTDSGILLDCVKDGGNVTPQLVEIPVTTVDEYKRQRQRVSVGVQRRSDNDIRRITSQSRARRSCSLPDILDSDLYEKCQNISSEMKSSESESVSSSSGSVSNTFIVESKKPYRKYSTATTLDISEPICGRQHLQEPCYVCFKDNEVYCTVCLRVHNFHCKEKCQYIPEITNDVKLEMCLETELELRCMRDRLDRILQENTVSLNQLKDNRTIYIKSVMELKARLIESVDRMEKEALLEMDIVFNARAEKLQENVTEIEKRLVVVNEYLNKLSSMEKNSEDNLGLVIIDLQTVTKLLKRYEDDIFHIHSQTSCEQMHFKPAKEVVEILTRDDKLWTMENVETFKCKRPSACTCDKPFKYRSISKHKEFTAQLSRWHFDRERCCITGCEFLPNGNLLLADNNNKKIKMFDKKYRYMSAQSLHSSPWDIAVIDADRSVVTIPDRKRLQFIHAQQKIVLKHHVKLNANCWGIAYDKDQLFVTCWSPDVSEILVTDLNGNPKRHINIVNDLPLHTPWFVRARDNVIYVSDWGTYMLSCVTVSGASVMKYRNRKFVGPLGLAFDTDSNLYVCGRDSNNIHQLSPEGELLQIILSSKDGIDQPLSLCYDKNDNRLVVTSWMADKVNVFKFL